MPFLSLEIDQIDFDIIDLSTETDFTQNFCLGDVVLVFETLFQSLEKIFFLTKYVKWSLWGPVTIAQLICCLMYDLEILFQSLEILWSISWKTTKCSCSEIICCLSTILVHYILALEITDRTTLQERSMSRFCVEHWKHIWKYFPHHCSATLNMSTDVFTDFIYILIYFREVPH